MAIKKKLKDLTTEEYKDWNIKNCGSYDNCNTCLFKSINCYWNDKKSWFYNKDSYSDKFLNQEIELENHDILDKKEKEYLQNVIKSFKNRVKYISKEPEIKNGYEHIVIEITSLVDYLITEYICLPYFKKGTMYTNMKVNRNYALETLGL